MIKCTLLYKAIWSSVRYSTRQYDQVYTTLQGNMIKCTLLYKATWSSVRYSVRQYDQVYAALQGNMIKCMLLYKAIWSSVCYFTRQYDQVNSITNSCPFIKRPNQFPVLSIRINMPHSYQIHINIMTLYVLIFCLIWHIILFNGLSETKNNNITSFFYILLLSVLIFVTM